MIPQSNQYYTEGNWGVFFHLLPAIERRIIYTIAHEDLTFIEIADKCLISTDRVELLLALLAANGIIYGFDGGGLFMPIWSIENTDFKNYCRTLAIATIFNPATIAADLTDEFYRLAAKRYRRIKEIGADVSLITIHHAIAKKIQQQASTNSI